MTKLIEIDYEPGRLNDEPSAAHGLSASAPPVSKLVPVDYEPEPYEAAPASSQGVVLPSIKRVGGQFVESVGTTIEDITGENAVTRGLQDFGGGVVKANPSQNNSVGDIVDKPWTAIKEAVAEQVPQLGAAFTGARLGAAAGGAFGPVGAAAGGLIGGLAPIAIQEYGEIRGKQKDTGEENIPLALGGATAATALERFGLDKFAIKAGVKGVREALGAIPEGTSRLAHAGQQGLKTALIEGPGTEIPQTAIERYAGGQDIGTAEAFDEYALAGAKGAIGGGVIGGGLGLVAPREQAPSPQPGGQEPGLGEVQDEPSPARGEGEDAAKVYDRTLTPGAAAPPDEFGTDREPAEQGGIQDLDPAAQRHMQDILRGGPPLAPLEPAPSAGPLGRAAAAGGITAAAPDGVPGSPSAPPSEAAGRKRGPLSPLGAEMSEQGKAEVAAEQARLAGLAQQGISEISDTPAQPTATLQHPQSSTTGDIKTAEKGATEPLADPRRFHKLNSARTESNARTFAEGLAGRFPDHTFEVVPHRLSKNKFAVKASPRDTTAVVSNETADREPQSLPDAQAQAAHEAATSPLNDLPQPTEPQKDAGNYRHGHVRYAGLNISIENPQGSKRSGLGPDGTPWEVEMQGAHYGYIKRTEGKDGEQVDVYLASEREDTPAFVVDQVDPKTGRFDEHKTVLGAASRAEAEAIYDAHFSDNSGPSRRQAVTELPMDGFKTWLKEGDTKKPIAGQAGVQATPPATIDAPQPAALPEEGGADASRATEPQPPPQFEQRPPGHLPEPADRGRPGGAREGQRAGGLADTGADLLDDSNQALVPAKAGESAPQDPAAAPGQLPEISPTQSLAQGEIAPPAASPSVDSSPKAENATTPVDPGKDADSGLLSNKQAVDSPEDAAQEVTPAPSSDQTRSQPGAKATVKTSGRSAEVHYALAEADDLVVSNDETGQINPSYPQELQPRDRSRVAMQAQVAAMAGSLDPALLGDSPLASHGAPIVGPDGVVESGNGRSMAISRAYREKKAEPYRRYLEENAERFGIDRAAIQGMRAPVLVRRRTSTFDDSERLAFVREANQTDVAAMSPVEQAFADAARLDAEAFATYRPGEDGDILARSNDAFRAIFLKGLSSEERNALMTADGRATKQLVDRIQAAVFARAYGDERLLGLLAEEADPDIKTIVNALNAAAGAFVRARSLNEQLTPYNIIPALVEGADFVRETRRTGQAVQEAIAQQDLFGARDPNALALAMFMDANKRSPRRLGEGFRAMAEFIEKELVRARNQNLFADTPPTLGQVIARVNDFMKERYGQEDAIQPDLFSQPERSAPIAEARPESREPEEGPRAGAQGAEAAEEVKPAEKPAEKKPFKEHIAELREKRQKRDAQIRARFERDGYVYAVSEKDPTLAILLTESTTKDGELRVTTLRDGEPTGHRDYAHLIVGVDSAASEFASSDYKIGPAPSETKAAKAATKPVKRETKPVEPETPTEADVDAMLAADMAKAEAERERPGHIENMVVEKAKRELAAGRINQSQYDNVIRLHGEKAAQYTAGVPTKAAKRHAAKAPPSKEELKDVGEKIEGARKDLWAGRALGHQDIEGMNERELQKFVTKEHVFPRPNYQAIADHINAEFGGRFDAAKQRFSEDVRVLDMGAGSALLIKKIRDSIENPPLGASRESLEDYLTAIGMVRKAIEDLQSFIVPTGSNLVKLAFGDDIVKNERYHIWNQESPNWKYLNAMGNKFARIAQVDARDWARAIMEADKTGFPKKQEVWQRDYRVFPKGDLKIGKGTKFIEGKPVDVFFLGAHEGRFLANFPTMAEAEAAKSAYTPYLVMAKKRGNLVKQVDTEAEGINFARDTYKAQHPTAKREDKTPELRHIVREGQDYRGGRDVGDNEFKDAFGFRGVQFGNWTDQRDRQQSLNHAYDALMDLAAALGVPPQALSLNGELGMAFGARGKGGFAAAHYEPTRVVINLTKTAGAGTAAHEWAHALDDYFGRLSGDLKGKKSPFASHGVSAKTAMRPEMVQAFKDVMSAINYRLQTNEEVIAAAQADIEKSKRYIASWLKRLRTELKDAERDGSGFDALATAVQDAAGDARAEIDVLFGYVREKNGKLPSKEVRNGLTANLDWRRRYYQRLNKAMSGEATPLKLPSTYAKLSTAKGPYWARAHELFARAFESFMLDKLAGEGRRSDYLVHPGKQAREETDPDYPYPAGAERKDINAAFEKFVASMAHKATEKGTALYSYAGERGAKTPKHALAAARAYAEQGVPMEEIRKTTGWHRAKDGLWRFEISDKDAKLKREWDSYGKTVGDALYHKALFENYPSLAQIDLVFRFDLPANVTGGYAPKDNAIHLNANLSPEVSKSTLLHELQHAVQVIEGFARGGKPSDKAFISAAAAMGIDTNDKSAMVSAYRRLLGEVEARDVQARMDLTAEELRERPPYVARGIPESDFIVQFKGEEAAEISAGQSAAGLRANLVRRLGSRAIEGLERAGFEIVETEAQLPEDLQQTLGWTIRGVHNPKTGKTYLVANGIPEGTEFRVLLHEVGVHYGLEGMIGRDKYRDIIRQLRVMEMAGNEAVRAARAAIPNDTPKGAVDDELIAYLVERHPDLPLVKRIIAALRAFLFRKGLIKNIRPEDVVALAKAAVRHVARGEPVINGAGSADSLAPAFAGSPLWYSEMAKFIDDKGPGKNTAAQWKVLLDGWAKAGKFKAEEVEWSGVKEWLDLERTKSAASLTLDHIAKSMGFGGWSFSLTQAQQDAVNAAWEAQAYSQNVVTKDQVLGFIRENGVRVEETTLSGEEENGAGADLRQIGAGERVIAEGYEDEETGDWIEGESGEILFTFEDRNSNDAETYEIIADEEAGSWYVPELREQFRTKGEAVSVLERYLNEQVAEARQAKVGPGIQGPTKFAQYQLPGGENYREVLLRLPDKPKTKRRFMVIDDQERTIAVQDTRAGAEEFMAPGRRIEARDVAMADQGDTPAFRSTHFDEPNIFAHIRFNERTDAEGKRVLFIEEIQSDWAQKGKREGFGQRNYLVVRPSGHVEGSYKTRAEAEAYIATTKNPDTHAIRESTAGSIPSAPFVGTTEAWVALALKRMIRHAAENGFDRIAWTTGEQQAERYDLSKQVNEIRAFDRGDGTYDMMIRDVNNKQHDIDKTPKDKLADTVGKELAEKILAQPDKTWTTYSGLDLKVGGAGMRAFYDQIVPNTANSLLKKLGGGRVRGVPLTIGGPEQSLRVRLPDGSLDSERFTRQSMADTKARDLGGTVEMVPDNSTGAQPGFDLTPALRESAMRGLPLFSLVYHGSPHAFERFDIGKIGTGEGAQAYGHGLYFAENPEVAKDYRNRLTSTIPGNYEGGSKWGIQGAAFPRGRSGHAALDTGQEIEQLLYYRKAGYPDMEQVVRQNIERRIERFRQHDSGGLGAADKDMRELADFYEQHVKPAKGDAIVDTSGHLYKVDIPDEHINKMLDYDAPLTKQPENVKEVVREQMGVRITPEMTGADFYAAWTKQHGGAEAASRSLQNYEIPGIRYLDQGSRGILSIEPIEQNLASARAKLEEWENVRGPHVTSQRDMYRAEIARLEKSLTEAQAQKPTRNFVVFDDKIVTVLDRNGEKLRGTEKRAAIEELQEQHPETVAGPLYSRPSGQTETPEFQRWFGDSKVVDKEGKPLVVYHGTGADFSVFDKTKIGRPGFGRGFHFAEQPDIANFYAEQWNRGERTGAPENVMPVYLSIKNPFTGDYYDRMEHLGITNNAEMTKALQEMGHDGIRYVHDAPDSNKRYGWVAFKPGQIKSAIGNTGAFDTANPDIRYSRATPPDPSTPEGAAAAVDRIGEAMRTTRHGWDAIKSKMLEDWRPAWLGIFTRRQLVDIGGDMVPKLADYDRYVQAMDADRNRFDEEAHVVAEAAAAYVKGHKKEADELFDVMHAATLSGVDPAIEYRPSIFRQEAYREIGSLKRRMRSRPGEADLLQAQIDEIRTRIDNEKVRKQAYPALKTRYAGLSEDAKAVYAQMRDLYSKRFDEREAALIQRVTDAEADERWKSRLIADIRLRFETARLLAPYFPLVRFGDYWVAATNPDGEREFHLRESAHQQKALRATLEAGGYRAIEHGFKIDTLFEQQGASAGFVSQIIKVLDSKKGSRSSPAIEGIKDEIYQIYLHSLPELSSRRHWIHREKVPGFSQDALRGFAKQMFHGNRQLARLRQQGDMEKALAAMRKQAREAADPNRAAQLVNEMQKRDEWIKNPTTASWANAAGGLGFLWYLTAPASAIVNVTQTPLVAYPLLAARHGWGAAAKALNGAMSDFFKGRFSVEGALKGEELDVYRRFLADGLIDKTQSHDLAGMSETPSAIYSGRTAKVMRAASFLFHRAERANREITALAAYRLARGQGLGVEKAYEQAKALTWESHFDYSNANKARFIQKDVARVLFMFKQFSQHMTYLLGRSAHQSLKGLTGAARREARVRLTGLLGMHALFAGALGMPLMGALAMVMNTLFDDEDEPYDFELEFRNFLAEAFGPEIGQAIVRGPVESLTGLGVAHRVGLSDLWFREPDKTLEGRGLVEYWTEQLLGPLGGIALKAGTAYEMFQEGHTGRALESMTPTAIRSGLQMLRYADEGVQSLRGDPVMEEVSTWNLLSQAAGFSPAELGQKYDANRAIKNLESRILVRRDRLINRWWLARRTGDMEGVEEAMAEIRRFNESSSIRQNPRARITPATLLASTRARQRYSRRAEGGIIVDQRLARLPEQVRFAP